MTGVSSLWLNSPMLAACIRITVLLLAPLLCGEARAFDTACPDASETGAYAGDTLRVLSLNLAHGRGTALNQLLVTSEGTRNNLVSVAATLQAYSPDVVALQEADDASRWSGNFNHVQWLRDRSGYACWLHGVHAESVLYRFGTALLTNVRLDNTFSHRFEPTPPTTNKGFVSARINWRRGEREQGVGLVSVHLDFSRGSVRRAQIGAVLDAVQARETPLIIMGDFNAGWEREDSVVRTLVQQGGLQVWQPEAGDQSTYKNKRLDWILITPELRFVHQEVAPAAVSDHRAVVADIGWAPDAGSDGLAARLP